MNLQKMLKQAQEMQGKIAEMQAKLEEEETQGSSGGGLVKVTLNGKGALKALSIDPSLLKEDEKDMLEDLIIAAFNDTKDKVEAQLSEEMSKVAGGMGLPPSVNLPF